MSKQGGQARWIIRAFIRNERGATAIEYAMIAVGLACAVAATVFGTGGSLNTNYYSKVNAAFPANP
ncbi:Flp family type IVb pilin [Hansschlegelia plantiphila]|uniref:Flp family type IVb pilin n=1 Tax=Hansschlegelia plantiphila TaxID=374655 RepID=A0A9W6J372_9HYPH|nr:Flp family type IVb pilin [Hansschlegelia plantiphila]GLK68450.1 hypothetical protein GCM10008179_20880 [Hansschlegelia plantiphila]